MFYHWFKFCEDHNCTYAFNKYCKLDQEAENVYDKVGYCTAKIGKRKFFCMKIFNRVASKMSGFRRKVAKKSPKEIFVPLKLNPWIRRC